MKIARALRHRNRASLRQHLVLRRKLGHLLFAAELLRGPRLAATMDWARS